MQIDLGEDAKDADHFIDYEPALARDHGAAVGGRGTSVERQKGSRDECRVKMQGGESKERRELMLLFSFPRPSVLDTCVRQPTLQPRHSFFPLNDMSFAPARRDCK